MKYEIIGIENIDDVYRYIIKKDKDIHRNFCNLLVDLNFDEESLDRVDVIFDELDNEFIYLNNDKYEIYFFITKEFVNLVIKSSILQTELNNVMQDYFLFPK